MIDVCCILFLSWSVFVFTQALDSFGSHHLLDNYLENYPKSKTGEIRNLVFMSAIKIGKWDLAIEERYMLVKKKALLDIYLLNSTLKCMCT